MTCVLLKGEFAYIEGVLIDGTTLFHHAWLYSKSLECFVDPILKPNNDMRYYISDVVDNQGIFEKLSTKDNI